MSLLTHAVATADTEELSADALFIKSRCEASGMDPDSYRYVIGAIVRLGPAVSIKGDAWRSDREFVGALLDLECALYTRLRRIKKLINEVEAALAQVNEYTDVEYLRQLYASLDVLHPAVPRVTAALIRVIAAPDELTEAYAVCYRHVRAGRKLPYRGRFISGEIALPPSA